MKNLDPAPLVDDDSELERSLPDTASEEVVGDLGSPASDQSLPDGDEPDADDEGVVALCEADQDIEFVQGVLDDLGIQILFDGSFRYRDDGADTSIRSRLARSQPTFGRLLDRVLLTAARMGVQLRQSEARLALERVVRQEQDNRRAALAHPLFEPRLTETEQRAAEAQWRRVATIFDNNGELCVAALKHFIWQVKRKLRWLAVEQHLMPIVTSLVQGSGKTTFVQKFLAPLDDLVANAVLLSDLADPRSVDLFAFPVVSVDDVGVLDRRSIEQLKSVVTAPRLTRRRLGTSRSASIEQKTTLIGTANRSVDELIADETGNRRFAMLLFRNGDERKGGDPAVWKTINEMDAKLLWRSVREDGPSPIDAVRKELHAWQEANRPRGEVEAWLETVDVNSQAIKAITSPAGVKAQQLYELFRRDTVSPLSNSKFGTEMTRLAEKPSIPFGKKVKTAAGTVYPLKPSK